MNMALPVKFILLGIATLRVASGQTIEDGSGEDQPTIPPVSCDSCDPMDRNLVCVNTTAYPNLCLALCIGIDFRTISICPPDLVAEVEAAFGAADAVCAQETCGATCRARPDCGWSTEQDRCIAGETTTEIELNAGDCLTSDPCRTYTCGSDCASNPNCGWSTLTMSCITGATTTDGELGLGDCLAGAFNMCESFTPCLNGGRCSTTGGYQFDCTCPPTHMGMVCEDEIASTAAIGTTIWGDITASSSNSNAVDDNPFGGIFVGNKISAANAMVISIVILIVSVVVSAVVLYIRRAKLRRENVTFSGIMDGADLPVKRRFDMGNVGSMHSLDLDYDNSMMGVEVDGYGDGNLQRVQGKAPKSRPGPVYSKSPTGDEYTEVNGIMVRSPKMKAIRSPESMLTCAQCGDDAPSANGCIDQDDNQWYCNTCWRGLEDMDGSEEA